MKERLFLAAALSFGIGCDGTIGSQAGDAGVESDASVDAGANDPDAAVTPLEFRVNMRSIGGAAGAVADTGTLSGAAGATTLQIAGANFPDNIGSGDRLTLSPGSADEAVFFITNRTNDNQIELDSSLLASATQVPYRVERAYTTIEAWATATKGDLVGEKRRELGICYDDAPFAENVVLSGSTVDETHYRVLTVAESERHSGSAGTGVVIRPTIAGNGISVLEDFARVEWVEVTDWTTNSGGSFDGINIRAENVLVQYVIVHDDGHGTATNSDAGGIQLERDLGSATVRNSIVYNLARIGIGSHSASGTVLTIENSTAYACVQQDNSPDSYGCITARGSGSVVNAKNVIALSAGGLLDFFAEPGASYGDSNFNLSSDASSPGANSIADAIPAAVLSSVAVGLEDCHLAVDSVALDSGAELTGFVDDIDGQLRGSLWDIGADER